MSAPQHRALVDPSRMCDMLSEARTLQARGWWEGSSYRDHPYGIVREGLIFENERRCASACEIRAMFKPDEPLGSWCNSPAAEGCPRPRPASGCQVVWRNGRWLHDGPWVAKASRILHDLEDELAELRAAAKAASDKKRDQDKASADAALAALRSAHMEPRS